MIAPLSGRQEGTRGLTEKVSRLVADKFGGDFGRPFAHYDRDKDGRIDKAELGKLLADAGIGNWLTRGLWADGIVAALDVDKDGTISAAEFQPAMDG